LAERWYTPETPFDRKILVPFCYQSQASGIGLDEVYETVWYRRRVKVPAGWKGRTLLKFGAVDYRADVWVGGQHVAFHEGGYTPFEVDITPHLGSDGFWLVVRASDPDDAGFPRGKQSWRDGKRFGCWYTPCTGIWQTVWMESVGASAVRSLQTDTDVDRRLVDIGISVDGPLAGLELRAEVSFQGKRVRTVEVPVAGSRTRVLVDLTWKDDLDLVYLWSPEHPHLFDLEVVLLKEGSEIDRVRSYFGMRKIEVVRGSILLNGVPLVQKLVLDQGYWTDTLLTPPSEEALIRDIELTKAFGFNGARKHQKIEDPRYYYHADRLGLLVWGELPSSYRFDESAMTRTFRDWQEFLARDRGHPSIITWVPLNESWGVSNILSDPRMQDFCRALYRLTKALDPTRLVSSNDGWEQVESDICAIHDYGASGEKFTEKTRDLERYLSTKSDWRLLYARGAAHAGEPLLMTEYGGIAFSSKKMGEWGYQGTVDTEAEFLERFSSMTSAVLSNSLFQGICYTQLTDVQQEVNGLLTPDRRAKVSPDAVRRILESR
jgi:beta-galactosidase/beta-glucuronidase